jgi:hypothetical protein
MCNNVHNKKNKIFVAFSPQANYADWATAEGRTILMNSFVDRRVSRD